MAFNLSLTVCSIIMKECTETGNCKLICFTYAPFSMYIIFVHRVYNKKRV